MTQKPHPGALRWTAELIEDSAHEGDEALQVAAWLRSVAQESSIAVEADQHGRMPSDDDLIELVAGRNLMLGCDPEEWLECVHIVLSRYGSSQPVTNEARLDLVSRLRALSRYQHNDVSVADEAADALMSGQPAASEEPCFCDRMYPDSNPDATCGDCPRDYRSAAPVAQEPNTHFDDDAVDHFATAMKDKLAQARAKGRHGWHECAPADLSAMLRAHVEKGDPLDVANFCMFLWSLGQPISAAPVAAQEQPVVNQQMTTGPTAQDREDAGIDAAFKAVRSRLCRLPRYIFVNASGGVLRVRESSGNWIEFSEAHALFDPVAVDAARAAKESP